MKTTPDTESKLLATLRRVAPARVIAFNGDTDDDAREISVPKVRKRWSRVADVLAGTAWSRLELLDAKGALLGRFDNTEPAGQLEDLSGNRTGELHPRDVAMTRTLLDMMLKAQATVLQNRDAELTRLMAAQSTVVEQLVAGMRELQAMYQQQVMVASDVAALQAQAEAGNGGAFKELLEAAPQLVQALPLIRGMLQGSPAQAPANGVKKPPA